MKILTCLDGLCEGLEYGGLRDPEFSSIGVKFSARVDVEFSIFIPCLVFSWMFSVFNFMFWP